MHLVVGRSHTKLNRGKADAMTPWWAVCDRWRASPPPSKGNSHKDFRCWE